MKKLACSRLREFTRPDNHRVRAKGWQRFGERIWIVVFANYLKDTIGGNRLPNNVREQRRHGEHRNAIVFTVTQHPCLVAQSEASSNKLFGPFLMHVNACADLERVVGPFAN